MSTALPDPGVSRLAALCIMGASCAPMTPSTSPPETTKLVVEPQTSGTSVLLQAVSAVNDRVAWVSGHRGTYLRTVDGGTTWQASVVPGADTLQFRDVHAVDSGTAYLLSAGTGDLSRIYKTTDGGRSWRLQFRNVDPKAFYDCMDFWDGRRGLAVSDAVDGRMVVLRTEDGGERWELVPAAELPSAQPGEGAFAASGTCLVTRPGGLGFIGTGNAPLARVLRTTDYGRRWSVHPVPIPAGEAAGITSLAFRDDAHGVAAGGPIGHPDQRGDVVAITRDGGRSWSIGGRPGFPGAVYAVGFASTVRPTVIVVAGPKGLAYSLDEGQTWTGADTLAYWGLGFSASGVGWATGPQGRIAKLLIRK